MRHLLMVFLGLCWICRFWFFCLIMVLLCLNPWCRQLRWFLGLWSLLFVIHASFIGPLFDLLTTSQPMFLKSKVLPCCASHFEPHSPSLPGSPSPTCLERLQTTLCSSLTYSIVPLACLSRLTFAFWWHLGWATEIASPWSLPPTPANAFDGYHCSSRSVSAN